MDNSINASLEQAKGSDLASQAGMYLTFELGGEIYGIEILKVQEIIGMMNVTRVPRTPDFVRGVINLRGKVMFLAQGDLGGSGCRGLPPVRGFTNTKGCGRFCPGKR